MRTDCGIRVNVLDVDDPGHYRQIEFEDLPRAGDIIRIERHDGLEHGDSLRLEVLRVEWHSVNGAGQTFVADVFVRKV